MTLLHPYESAEALCRRRNKVSTAAEWQVIWADSRWYGPAMMSRGVSVFVFSVQFNEDIIRMRYMYE